MDYRLRTAITKLVNVFEDAIDNGEPLDTGSLKRILNDFAEAIIDETLEKLRDEIKH